MMIVRIEAYAAVPRSRFDSRFCAPCRICNEDARTRKDPAGGDGAFEAGEPHWSQQEMAPATGSGDPSHP